MSETEKESFDDLAEGGQTPMFDLSGETLNAMWVDEKQPLFIPNSPKHYKAHKYQVLLSRLEKQAQHNPAQVNLTLYKTTLDEYIQLVKEIQDEILDSKRVVAVGESGAAQADGDLEPISMDS